jgi:HopA1 effector protein family
MEREILAELKAIIEAVQFTSLESFTFAGRASTPTSPLPQPAQDGNLLPVVNQLQQYLYGYCYSRRFDGTTGDMATSQTASGDGFVESLSHGNLSVEKWDRGWQIYQLLPSGQLMVYKNGLFRAIWPGEFVFHDSFGKAPQPGMLVSVFFPRDSNTIQPGFYFVFGSTVGDQLDDYNIFRLYWNITCDGAPAVIRALSGELNRFQIPFRYKCPDQRAFYYRVDTGILYVSKRFLRITLDVAAGIYPSLREYLESATPLFTKELAPGLAAADDPGGQESFGISRCRMLAQGLYNAYVQGKTRLDDRMEAVVQEFAKNGVSLDQPYLNAGSRDEYAWPEAGEQVQVA